MREAVMARLVVKLVLRATSACLRTVLVTVHTIAIY